MLFLATGRAARCCLKKIKEKEICVLRQSQECCMRACAVHLCIQLIRGCFVLCSL
uniref:Uncharacterized protein n=1 Tax=Triticum urartu TaxID=4572 RepID=A0A8R7QH45_TRIUA